MLRELATVDPERACSFLTAASDVASMRHFTHSNNLRETLWMCLPQIASAVGKKAFKPYLEFYLGPMFRDLQCDHQLCECAAGLCIAAMRDLLGSAVFMSRLDDVQIRILDSSPLIPAPKQVRSACSSASQPGSLAAMMSTLPPGSAIPHLLGHR